MKSLVKLGILAACLGLMNQSFAQDTEVQNLVSKYHSIKKSLLVQEEEKRKVLSDLFKVVVEIKKINKKKTRLTDEKIETESRIKETNEALASIRTSLQSQRTQLMAQLRVLYKFHGSSTMRLIFSSQSGAELDRNLKILKIISDRNYQLIKNYRKNITNFALQKQKLDRHVRHMAEIKKEMEEQEVNLVTQQEQKNQIIKTLDQSAIDQLSKLEKIRFQSQQMEQIKRTGINIDASFFENRGKLPPPVDAIVTQQFGLFSDKQQGTKLRFKGQFYKIPTSQKVRSVFKGDVTFADWIDGFGFTVVLSHGDRYHSVYANLKELNVKAGEAVNAQVVVGRSNDSSLGMGKGFYFEIRHFSEPLDPQEWLAARTQKISINDHFQARRPL